MATRTAAFRYALRHPLVAAGAWACAAGAALVLAAGAAAWPALQAQATLADELAEGRRQLVQRRERQALAQAVSKARAHIATLDATLTQAPSQSVVVDHLVRLAHEQRLHIVSQAYEEGRGGHAAAVLTVELVVHGRYDALRGFLDRLPTLPLLSEVHEAAFQALPESGGIKGRMRIALHRVDDRAAKP